VIYGSCFVGEALVPLFVSWCEHGMNAYRYHQHRSCFGPLGIPLQEIMTHNWHARKDVAIIQIVCLRKLIIIEKIKLK
jgi:hypothetical protein